MDYVLRTKDPKCLRQDGVLCRICCDSAIGSSFGTGGVGAEEVQLNSDLASNGSPCSVESSKIITDDSVEDSSDYSSSTCRHKIARTVLRTALLVLDCCSCHKLMSFAPRSVDHDSSCRLVRSRESDGCCHFLVNDPCYQLTGLERD